MHVLLVEWTSSTVSTSKEGMSVSPILENCLFQGNSFTSIRDPGVPAVVAAPSRSNPHRDLCSAEPDLSPDRRDPYYLPWHSQPDDGQVRPIKNTIVQGEAERIPTTEVRDISFGQGQTTAAVHSNLPQAANSRGQSRYRMPIDSVTDQTGVQPGVYFSPWGHSYVPYNQFPVTNP